MAVIKAILIGILLVAGFLTIPLVVAILVPILLFVAICIVVYLVITGDKHV